MPDEIGHENKPTQSQTRLRPNRKVPVPPAKPERIRAELNIERWPAMWQPSKSKTKPTVRTFEREMTFSSGDRGVAKLEVGFTQFGTVTTEDQKMLYVLVKHWEDSGKPSSQVFFSDRLLARLLRKSWGTNVIDAITGSLRRLRLTPFRWMKSYRRKESPEKEVEEEVPFTMLSDLKIIRRKVDGHVTNQQGYFQFDRNLLENLLANYTKPLLLEEFLKLRSEVGQLIYSHIDLIMSDKSWYERCSKDLFRDLGLGELVYYQHASHRKQALERALKEMRGIGMSTGVLKSAMIERTKDGKDYKVVFHKTARAALAEAGESEAELPREETGTVVINDYKLKDPLVGQAEGLLAEFYKRFHRVDTHYPQAKETAQALSLITQHGLERARYVIQFAHTAAAASNYAPQTFGGVLQYTSRALADFDRVQGNLASATDDRPQHSQPVPHTQRARYSRGESRLLILTPEQYEVRAEQARSEIRKQYPNMVQLLAQNAESKIGQTVIRAFVIRQLEQEPMDVVVIGEAG